MRRDGRTVCELCDIAREHAEGTAVSVQRWLYGSVLMVLKPTTDSGYFCERENQSVSVACVSYVDETANGGVGPYARVRWIA